MPPEERDKEIVKPYSLFHYLMQFSTAIQFRTRPEIFKDDLIGMSRLRDDYSERFHPMILPDSRNMLSHTSIRLIVSSWENYCVAKIQTYKKYSDEYPEKWEALALHRGVYYESSNRIKEAFDLIDVMAFDDERHVELFNQVMIIRNAIVHDWGMITESNYEELRMSDKEIGHPLMLDPEQLDNCFSVIYHAVKNIEWAIDQKLNVKLAVTFFGGDVDWNEINIL